MTNQEPATKHVGVVRYCPSCSSIGEVPKSALNCCPDHNEVYIPLEVAKQAKYGFDARLKEATA